MPTIPLLSIDLLTPQTLACLYIDLRRAIEAGLPKHEQDDRLRNAKDIYLFLRTKHFENDATAVDLYLAKTEANHLPF